MVVVCRTPGTLDSRPATTSAIRSKSGTRTIAIRSTSPATEYTSLTPSRSAISAAMSGIRSGSTEIMTIVVIIARS